ncbi:FecR family protein [Flavivirga spongiicola]|uniref:FecR family protein n=1 Tax=Flavivirga spongiicola TaxID=421621 RepID=A0ABU7XZC1_9FLAO|nr:FecR family protein [Flavivirga sp. MEBiC05379]MDO5981143.1 FecR family protein [Flavivirga sp. MEBiC05379]
MKNRAYTNIEDLINDASFVNWVHKKQMADIDFWDNWLLENPDKKQLVFDAKDILIGVKFNKSFVSEQKTFDAWEKFEKHATSTDKVYKIPFYKNKKYQGIAAAILLFIAVSAFYFTSKPATIVHKTAYGEILDIKLPDGTKVKLNSNSVLSYNDHDLREVVLEGEAFFNVEKKPVTNAKFLVTTDDLKVEVYGTSFNVNKRNTRTQVFLEEGSIALKLKNGIQKKMIPGDLVSYSYKTDKIIEEKRILRPELQTSWKNGSLIFDRSTLESAMSKIEDTYGITAIFEDDDSKNILITGAVPTQNLEICIKTIEKSAQVAIVNQNNKLYINKN